LSKPVNAVLGTPDSAQIQIRRQIHSTAPVITVPADGAAFTDSEITVRGNTGPGASVEIFVNNISQGTTLSSGSGYFSLSRVRISEGENVISAVATNAYGLTSPVSASVTVSLDLRPQPPGGLSAVPGDTVAVINWNPSAESDVKGYRIYRDGQRLNISSLLTQATFFTDTCLTNGRTYAYTVTAVDRNESESLKSDSVKTMPVAGAEWATP